MSYPGDVAGGEREAFSTTAEAGMITVLCLPVFPCNGQAEDELSA